MTGNSGCGCLASASPAQALLAADAGSFAALGSQDVGVAGVGVAPAQVGVQRAGLGGVVGVVGVREGELPQWSEVRFDRLAQEALVGAKQRWQMITWSVRGS